MTRPAFAAWLSKPGSFHSADRCRFVDAAGRTGLRPSHIGEGVMIATVEGSSGPGGRIIGPIFRRGDDTALTADAVEPLLQNTDGARVLVRDFWGDYIAIGAKAGAERYALRSPFGDLSCYWHEASDHVVLASSIRLLGAFGGPAPAVDWRGLSHFLVATDLRNGRTCLRDIQELGAGQMLQVALANVRIRCCWSPWSCTEQMPPFQSRDAAANAMRSAIDVAVSACVNRDTPVILLLSGGLDSSTVAAALAACTHHLTCLTMVVADAQGDERRQARAVAHHLNVPLVEIMRDPEQVDFTRPFAPGLPRPTGAPFRQATLAAADRLARDTGAKQVIDGGGGDNMFCSLQSVVPVIDALLGLNRAARPLATAASIARMANVSLVSVMHRAALRMMTGRVAYRWPIDRMLLNPAMIDDFIPLHPWLVPPQGTPPGKAAQVGLLLAAVSVVGNLEAERRLAILSPLVSQPIAEAALRVPSWMWFEEGRNRAPVRRAYATRLPTSVVSRRSKGTPTGFLARLVEKEADMLRPFLLDGCLAIHGVIDRAAVEAALAPGPARDLRFARLLQLADAEAWARSWN